MIYKNYYKELGLTSTATTAEIKKAYRSLAKKYHPDKARGDKKLEEKFKTVNEAHEVLSDPVKRKKYDQFGAEWKQYEAAGAKPGGFDWSKYANAGGGQSHQSGHRRAESGFDDDSVNDLFEMLFGQRTRGRERGRERAVQGEDLTTETSLTLEEAYHGTTRLIQVHGQTIKVTIRPGIADRQILRIEGKGGQGSNGGSNGDIYLTISIAPHPELQRRGDDLHRILPVELYTAVLGGKTIISAMKGKVTVNIPKGTPNGKELRLLGLGMPVYGKKDGFGNLLVKIEIVLPEVLTEEEVELFTKLSALRRAS